MPTIIFFHPLKLCNWYGLSFLPAHPLLINYRDNWPSLKWEFCSLLLHHTAKSQVLGNVDKYHLLGFDNRSRNAWLHKLERWIILQGGRIAVGRILSSLTDSVFLTIVAKLRELLVFTGIRIVILCVRTCSLGESLALTGQHILAALPRLDVIVVWIVICWRRVVVQWLELSLAPHSFEFNIRSKWFTCVVAQNVAGGRRWWLETWLLLKFGNVNRLLSSVHGRLLVCVVIAWWWIVIQWFPLFFCANGIAFILFAEIVNDVCIIVANWWRVVTSAIQSALGASLAEVLLRRSWLHGIHLPVVLAWAWVSIERFPLGSLPNCDRTCILSELRLSLIVARSWTHALTISILALRGITSASHRILLRFGKRLRVWDLVGTWWRRHILRCVVRLRANSVFHALCSKILLWIVIARSHGSVHHDLPRLAAHVPLSRGALGGGNATLSIVITWSRVSIVFVWFSFTDGHVIHFILWFSIGAWPDVWGRCNLLELSQLLERHESQVRLACVLAHLWSIHLVYWCFTTLLSRSHVATTRLTHKLTEHLLGHGLLNALALVLREVVALCHECSTVRIDLSVWHTWSKVCRFLGPNIRLTLVYGTTSPIRQRSGRQYLLAWYSPQVVRRLICT